MPNSVSNGIILFPGVEEAICSLFHLRPVGGGNNWWFNRATPFVCYGPVKEGDNWFFEVTFQFVDNAYILPANKTWTAVFRQAADGTIITCELGADIPTLRDGQFPPPPAAQTKVFDTKKAIEAVLNPRKVIAIPPAFRQGEVTILEDTLGMVDDASYFNQFIT
jgi:hypothetical protein